MYPSRRQARGEASSCGSNSRSFCPPRSCPTSWRSSSRRRVPSAHSPQPGITTCSRVIMAMAVSSWQEQLRTHGTAPGSRTARPDVGWVIFQDPELSGGLGAASRVLYGWDGWRCAGALSRRYSEDPVMLVAVQRWPAARERFLQKVLRACCWRRRRALRVRLHIPHHRAPFLFTTPFLSVYAWNIDARIACQRSPLHQAS